MNAFFSFLSEGKGLSKVLACLSQVRLRVAIRGGGILYAMLCHMMSALQWPKASCGARQICSAGDICAGCGQHLWIYPKGVTSPTAVHSFATFPTLDQQQLVQERPTALCATSCRTATKRVLRQVRWLAGSPHTCRCACCQANTPAVSCMRAETSPSWCMLSPKHISIWVSALK